MENYDKLNEFAAKVNAGEKQFIVTTGNDGIHFISCQHGEVDYFYACKKFESSDFRNLDNKYEIAAIVANGTIYIVDWMIFSIFSFEKKKEFLPENVVGLDEFVKELNHFLFDVAYPEYYANLKTATSEEILDKNTMLKSARRKLFTGKENEYDYRKINGITRNIAAEMLCDNSDIKTVCFEILESQRNAIDYNKSRKEYIQSLIDGGNAAQHWEISLADAINLTEAKTVIVEFELNGKIAETKMDCVKIISALIDDDYFSSWDFPSMRGGGEFLMKFGVESRFSSERLYPKNIKSISFRGKKIFER